MSGDGSGQEGVERFLPVPVPAPRPPRLLGGSGPRILFHLLASASAVTGSPLAIRFRLVGRTNLEWFQNGFALTASSAARSDVRAAASNCSSEREVRDDL